MKKKLLKYICISMLFAFILGIAYFFTNIQTQTVRNGEEYVDNFLDGQVFIQEVMLNNTPKLSVSVLPMYNKPDDSIGIKYNLSVDSNEYEGFIPLNTCANKQWTSIKIDTNKNFYKGIATLKLEAVGLNQDNTVQFLITTNTLQKNPDLTLSKDNQIIENGCLVMAYKELKYQETVIVFIQIFLVILLITILYNKFINNIRKYPSIYITGILFIISLIKFYPTFSQINLHVSAQYFFSWLDLGFVRRSFIGTLIDILNIDFNVSTYIKYGILSIIVLLLLQLYIINNKKFEKDRIRIGKYYILFICMPFGLLAFWQSNFFARLDQILMIFFLLSCIAIIKEKGLFLIPIFSILAIISHEMYLAMFIPFVFCLLLYKWSIDKNRKYMICLVWTSVLSVIFGGYLGFIAKPIAEYADVWSKIQSNYSSDLIWEYPLQVNFFMSKEEVLASSFSTIYLAQTIPLAIYSIILLGPIILLTLKWFVEYYKIQNNKISKYIICIFPFTLSGLFLSMYLMCDWGRLFVMYGFAVFFSFITLLSIDRTNTIRSIDSITNKIDKNIRSICFISLCVFYIFLTLNGTSSTTLFDFVNFII